MKWILVIFMSYLSYSQQEFNFNEYNKKCGDLFRYIELNQPNEITLIHKKEKIRIVLSQDEWRSVYAGQEDKLDVFKFKNYIGFYIGVNSDFIYFEGNKFRKEGLGDFLKLIIKKSDNNKICFIVKIDRVMKEKSILEIWDFLYYIHRVSNNRVAYIRFDVPEEDAQEPPSCPPPEKTAHQILSDG